MSKLEHELREAYFTLWQAVEDGIDTDMFFKLRETFRGIRAMVEEDDKPDDELQILTNLRSTYFRQQTIALDNNNQINVKLYGRLINDIDKNIVELQPTYSPECFDGRYFKWDGYVLDSMPECEDDNIMVLTRDDNFLGDFHIDPRGYEDDQEGYLDYALETVKNWIIEQYIPAILKDQQA